MTKTVTPKGKTALQIAFWGNVVLVSLMVLFGVPLLQTAAFVIFIGFVGRGLFYGKSFKTAAIIIAGLMAVLNLTIPSGIDVLIWIISLALVLI